MAYLTLTFDLVTLTLGQLQHLININPMYDFDQDPVIRSWFIEKNIGALRTDGPTKRRTDGPTDTQLHS